LISVTGEHGLGEVVADQFGSGAHPLWSCCPVDTAPSRTLPLKKCHKN
jgi:hypothetical protein